MRRRFPWISPFERRTVSSGFFGHLRGRGLAGSTRCCFKIPARLYPESNPAYSTPRLGDNWRQDAATTIRKGALLDARAE